MNNNNDNLTADEAGQLHRLLRKFHNSINDKNCSFFGANMDRALCRDLESALCVRLDLQVYNQNAEAIPYASK